MTENRSSNGGRRGSRREAGPSPNGFALPAFLNNFCLEEKQLGGHGNDRDSKYDTDETVALGHGNIAAQPGAEAVPNGHGQSVGPVHMMLKHKHRKGRNRIEPDNKHLQAVDLGQRHPGNQGEPGDDDETDASLDEPPVDADEEKKQSGQPLAAGG